MTDMDPQAQARYADGLRYLEKGLFGEAVSSFQLAIALEPLFFEAYNNLGRAYNEAGEFEKSIETCLYLISLNPSAHFVYQNIAKSLGEMGRHTEALSYYYKYIALNHHAASAYSDLFLTLNYLPIPRETMFLEHFKFHTFDTGNMYKRAVSKKQKINIGYVSGDFREHPVAHLFFPVLKNHDRTKFSLFLYSNTSLKDDITKKIQECGDAWRDITNTSDDEIIALIKDDQIDILVDLSGHTGGNKLTVFAKRAAPIQVSWLGYMNTTGLTSMDYRITDPYLSLPGSDQYYTETLSKVFNSFTFDPIHPLPDIGELPVLQNGFITFGSLNNFKKITSDVYDTWAQILKKIPTSRLIFSIKGNAHLIERVLCEFECRGIDRSRITIIGQKLFREYLQLFNTIDILLDPFPFTGCITVFHGLWGGVPSIVMEGISEYERNGPTVMKKVGLYDFIAHSKTEYVDKAYYWATHVEDLAHIRRNMRERFPKNEDKEVAKGIEDAFVKMYNS